MLLTRFLLGFATTSLALSFSPRDWQPWNSNGLPACSAEVDGLISGIEINILAQQGERNATENLQAIESQNPVDMVAFAAGKAVLVNDIMFGMTIRRYNQLIAPAGNAALSGLATVCFIHSINAHTDSFQYASAQAVELALSQSLNGIPSHDLPILAMLVTDVTNGIALNSNNTELVGLLISIWSLLTDPGCERLLLTFVAISAHCCGGCCISETRKWWCDDR